MTTIIILSVLLAITVVAFIVAVIAAKIQSDKRVIQSNRADAQSRRADDNHKEFVRVCDLRNELQEQLIKLQAEYEKVSVEGAETYDKLKEACHNNAHLETRVEEAEHARAMADAANKGHKAEIDDWIQRVTNVEKRNDHLSGTISKLEHENKQLILERGDLEIKLQRSMDARKKINDDLTELGAAYARTSEQKTEADRKLQEINNQLTATTQDVLDGKSKGVGYVDHPNGNRVFYIVVTPAELQHSSYLSWPDAKLGALLRSRMVVIENHEEEEGELSFTSAALLMVSRMAESGATDFDIDLHNLEGPDGERLGDAKVVIQLGGTNHKTFDRALASSPLSPTGVPMTFDIDGIPMVPRDQHDALIERIVTAKEKDVEHAKRSVDTNTLQNLMEESVRSMIEEDDEPYDTGAM